MKKHTLHEKPDFENDRGFIKQVEKTHMDKDVYSFKKSLNNPEVTGVAFKAFA